MKRAHQITIGTLFQWGTEWHNDCPMAMDAFYREFANDPVYREVVLDLFGRLTKTRERIGGFRLFPQPLT